MKKPEKKENPPQDYISTSFLFDSGYNRACDEWEAYIKNISDNLIKGKDTVCLICETNLPLPSEEEILEIVEKFLIDQTLVSYPHSTTEKLTKAIAKRIGK